LLCYCRLPGRASVVRKLREAFDEGGSRPSLSGVDVHSVASLLKCYLCDLPGPVIPVAHYDRVMHIVTRERPVDSQTAIRALSAAVSNLPRTNYALLRYLCRFLADVARYSPVNRMTAGNLALVFSPCVIKPEVDDPALLAGTAINRATAVQDMIDNYSHVFALSAECSETPAHSNCSLVDVETGADSAHSLLNGSMTHTPPGVVMQATGRPDCNLIAGPDCEGHEHLMQSLGSLAPLVNDDEKTVKVSDASADERCCPSAVTDAASGESEARCLDALTDVGCRTGRRSEPLADAAGLSQLQSRVWSLEHQLQTERRLVTELRKQLSDSARQTSQLVSQLSDERSATSAAVMRVVELQTKLQQYNVKFGTIDD